MQLQFQSHDMNDYLRGLPRIASRDSHVLAAASKFSTYDDSPVEKVKVIYEFVRDQFPHTFDIGAHEVSVTAADVLLNGHGICYAKANLLAALLRNAGIPAGFCYQLLIFDDKTAPYIVVHALNAVFIDKIGRWIRLDARGNKEGVNAQFSLGDESLAFPVREQLGEKDVETVYFEPVASVMSSLTKSKTADELKSNLPRKLF